MFRSKVKQPIWIAVENNKTIEKDEVKGNLNYKQIVETIRFVIPKNKLYKS